MIILKRKKLASAIAAISSATVLSIASLAWAAPEMNVTLDSNAMITTATAADNVYVRIAGPNGYFKELRGTDIAQWNPEADAPDGSYRYDSYISVNTPQGEMSKQEWERVMEQNSSQKSGLFSIENGLIIPPQETSYSEDEKQSSNDAKGVLEQMLMSALDIMIPSANAADLTASSSIPWVSFDDTNHTGLEWRLEGEQSSASLGAFRLHDYMGSNGHKVIEIFGQPSNAAKNNEKSLTVGTSGDMGLANNTIFIDRSRTDVGIGTTTPLTPLHIIQSSLADISLQVTTAGAPRFEMEASSTQFNINENNSTGKFFVWKGAHTRTLNVGSEAGPSGNVGVGTSTPTSTLHVKKADAVLKVEDTNGATAVRTVVQLKNKGAVGFSMEDTTQGTWQFRTSSSGAFIMNKLDNVGSELTVFDNGNATFKGTVRANGVLLTSSRESKTDFSAIKPNEIMRKLAKMNVEEWRYKEADKNDRHISPMAEDFHSLFKFGSDNTGINPNDLASVAIIAAKELQKKATLAELETTTLKASNASLKKQLVAQQKRLASLEKLVTNLASSNEHLNSSGAKVALK